MGCSKRVDWVDVLQNLEERQEENDQWKNVACVAIYRDTVEGLDCWQLSQPHLHAALMGDAGGLQAL